MGKIKKNILVAGIGNEILADDGVGPKLVDHLKRDSKIKNVDFEKLNVGGLEVLEFIQGYRLVIFIDAIKTRNGNIGDVYTFTPNDFIETANLSNLHDISFLTALEVGRSMNFKIPDKIYIIAVEIKEDRVFSEYFTKELASRYSEVKDKIENLVKALIKNTDDLVDASKTRLQTNKI